MSARASAPRRTPSSDAGAMRRGGRTGARPVARLLLVVATAAWALLLAETSLASPLLSPRREALTALQAPSQALPPEFGVRIGVGGGGENDTTTTGGEGRRVGAVAVEVDVCSNIGAEALQKGGSAADAIISAALCVGSMAGFHSGLGGGGFALLRHEPNASSSSSSSSGRATYEMLDFRERAPLASKATMYEGKPANASLVGGLAVGVPGEMRAWEALHGQTGRLAWRDLFLPAIRLNRHGFKVPSQLAVVIDQYKDSFICRDALFAEVYCPNGRPAKLGQTIRNPRLARTLETLAEGGAEAFYHGDVARNLVSTVRASGGIMTMQDLAEYRVERREPMSVRFGDKLVWSTVAPSSGSVVLSSLNVMNQYPTEAGAGDADEALTTHRLIEAAKWGYAIRASGYGDPAFVTNVTQLQRDLLTPATGESIRRRIADDRTFPTSYYDAQGAVVRPDGGTSAMVARDPYGLTVALTTTVNYLFGAQLMTPDGIVLNDEMDDFNKPSSSSSAQGGAATPNLPAAGKRPQSSISPTIVEDEEEGGFRLAVASAGGIRIVTAVLQSTFHALRGDSLQQALARPRWHDQLTPNSTSLEWQESYPRIPNWQGFSNDTARFLASLGHNVSYVTPGSTTAQGLELRPSGNGSSGSGGGGGGDEGLVLATASEVRQLAARGAAVPIPAEAAAAA